MSCRICGRNACIESFHSIEEQEQYEEIEIRGKRILVKKEQKDEETKQ